jgi:hypothetical protein
MTRAEKMLYHQIHPLKLAADISSCVVSSALLWRHRLVAAMVVAWLPAIVATVVVIHFAALERQRDSAFGRYVRASMAPAVIAERMAGQIVMWLGAHRHEPAQIALGGLVIVLAWLSGLGRPSAPQSPPGPPSLATPMSSSHVGANASASPSGSSPKPLSASTSANRSPTS